MALYGCPSTLRSAEAIPVQNERDSYWETIRCDGIVLVVAPEVLHALVEHPCISTPYVQRIEAHIHAALALTF
jgi:hypothetical protein